MAITLIGLIFFSDEKFTMNNYLIPKLAPSNLAYADLFFDPKAGKVRRGVMVSDGL